MAGMVGNFAALSATGAEHVGQPQIIDIPRPIHIQSRVARRSYGYQDPNGPMNQVVWFVSEVCLTRACTSCLISPSHT